MKKRIKDEKVRVDKSGFGPFCCIWEVFVARLWSAALRQLAQAHTIQSGLSSPNIHHLLPARNDERNSQSSSLTIILSPISSFFFSPFPCPVSTSSTPLFDPSFAPLTCDNSHHNGEAQSNKRRQDLRSVPVLSISPLTRLTRIYSQPSMTHTRSSR